MSAPRCIFAWMLPVQASFRCQAHSHDCAEVVFTRGARGLLHQGDQTYRYQDGTVFIYQPGVCHAVENEVAGEHLCLGIAGGRTDAMASGLWRAPAGAVRHFHEIGEVLETQDALAQERLDLLCGLVVCDLLALQRDGVPEASSSRAQQARRIIDESLDVSLSLEQLARRVYVSPEYLRKLFRSEFGEAITHYILRRRLELAARLLATSGALVKEIASQAGFQSEYYFSRAFRKAMGVSPSEYRRNSADTK